MGKLRSGRARGLPNVTQDMCQVGTRAQSLVHDASYPQF